MHMMSKKELSSGEVWTVKRTRTPTVVLTANGEVHTNEEAHVFVHDLNQFGTVQVLEETSAVFSLGKLCEDHGYSYEWVSGQKAHCKTDNFVPLVVPGLSVSSESSSFSASQSQDSLREDARLVSGNMAAASSSTGSVSERSDELATGRLRQEKPK